MNDYSVKKCAPALTTTSGIAYDALIAKSPSLEGSVNSIVSQWSVRKSEQKYMIDPKINCYYQKDRLDNADKSQVSVCQEEIDLCLSDKTTAQLSYPLNQAKQTDAFLNDIKAYTVYDGIFWDPFYGRSTGIVYYRLSNPSGFRLYISSVDNSITYKVTLVNGEYVTYFYENGGIRFGQTLKTTDFDIKTCVISPNTCSPTATLAQVGDSSKRLAQKFAEIRVSAFDSDKDGMLNNVEAETLINATMKKDSQWSKLDYD